MQPQFPQRYFHLWRWFDPRGRKMGSWAFILNRITALGLTLIYSCTSLCSVYW